jgi:hypothetical protein
MQLTLTSPGRAALGAIAPVRRSAPAPSREQALSQLDRIAIANGRATGGWRGGAAVWLALLGGCVVLSAASMWQGGSDMAGARNPSAAVASAPPATPAPVAAATAAQPDQTVQTAPAAEATSVPSIPDAAAVAAAPQATNEAAAMAAETPRAVRVRASGEARRRPDVAPAQERAVQEEQARRVERSREQEAAAQAEAERRRPAAAEPVRVAAVQLAEADRPGVRAGCAAAGGFLAQQFCQARTCAKAEFSADAVCVRLRESEAERLRASAER